MERGVVSVPETPR